MIWKTRQRDTTESQASLAARGHSQLVALVRAVVAAASGPVIVAGSIASLGQIGDVASAGAWGFTIGGAIFEGLLPGGPDIADQIKAVLTAAVAPGSRRFTDSAATNRNELPS